MKERLEDITGEAEAEKLIRTEYLDEASMYRFTEHVERGGRQEANRERWESALSGTEQMTAAASGQTRRLRSLNEEVKRLRILIRNLNKLLTAIMEGSIALGQDVFGEFLIENLANLAAVSEEQKAILKIYVRFAYGGTQPTLTIPFYLAKKYRLFHSSVVMSELVAEGEYWEKREEFREKRRADMRERLERLRDHVRRGEEYIAEYDRTHTHMAGLPKFKEYYEEERWLVKDRKDRDDLEQNFETKLEESVRNFNNSFDYELLRKELVPKDITTRIDPAEKDNVMRACIKELDTTGQTALQIIREFVNFCTLLAEPENRIKVKSGQYTEREINARTEQDMIGERARELMALPKYTVYVKKLDSSRGTKIYKSTTKELPDRNADRHDIDRMITRTRETVCRIRRDIQDEIYNRQMPVIENSEPPRPYD